MPDYTTASLLHAAYYAQVLYTLNDGYLHGGEEQRDALSNFDVERTNIFLARDKLPTIIARIDTKQESNAYNRAVLDLCNTFPDAGAYLISVKLNATQRIQWLLDALQASQKLGNDVTTQAHLGNLGLAYHELGELSKAIKYFTQALQLAERIGDKYHQGAWLGDLGNTYAVMGDHEKAIEYHERHLGFAREINNSRAEAHALTNLGVSYAYLGNLPKAFENYKQVLELAVKSGDRFEEARALMNLGFAYFDMGDLDEADRSLKSALSIAINLGDKLTQSLVMGGLADLDIECKEYPIAIQNLNQAIGILKEAYDVETELRLLQSLGNAYSASDDYDRATAIYSRLYTLAESTGAKAAICTALANQASIYRHIGSLDHALETAEKGLDLANEIHSLSDDAFLRWQIGLIYEAYDEKDKAIGEMEIANEIEAQIRSFEFEQHRGYIRNFILRNS